MRLIALGNEAAGDDGAALAAVAGLEASRLAGHGVEPRLVGRIGVGLLDLLEGDEPVVLVDVVQSGAPAGTIHDLDLADAVERLRPAANVSSHGFGPTEVLELAATLGRVLPSGRLIGIEGKCFQVGSGLSPEVEAALPALRDAIGDALAALEERARA